MRTSGSRFAACGFLLLAWITPSAAPAGEPGWFLGECRSETAAQRAAFRKAVLQAQPGDPNYLPHPYPKTGREVVEDFLYFHRRVWARHPQKAPEQDRLLLQTIERGQARFEVLRVANWTTTRCERDKDRHFYSLIRIISKEDGRELARVATDDAGFVARLTHRPEDDVLVPRALPPVPRPLAVAAQAEARLGAPATAAGLVTVGGTLRCDVLRPCVALKSAGGHYLVHQDRLYRIADERPRISFTETLGDPRTRGALTQSLRRSSEELISLGGDVMGIAVPIDPQ